MRIFCDSCGAKYSIADEKVMGKVFKIRCKKCSHVIVVRGTSAAPAETSAPAPAQSHGHQWYVVRAGEQAGPYSEADLQGLLHAGEIAADTYTWREGFDDWIHLSAVQELSHLEPSMAAPPAQEPDASAVLGAAGDLGASAGGGLSDATEAMDISSFNAPPQEQPEYAAPSTMQLSGDAAQALASADAAVASSTGDSASMGGGMFSGFDAGSNDVGFDPSASFDGGLNAVVPEAPAPNKSSGLVGARNENSVLFSLNNLSQKVMEDAVVEAPSNTEASGLIDIRALSASAAAVSSARDGGTEEGFGPMASPAPAMHVPAMMPMGTRKSNTPLYIAIAGSLLVVLLVGGVLAGAVVWYKQVPDPVVKEKELAAVDPEAESAKEKAPADTPAEGDSPSDQPDKAVDDAAAGTPAAVAAADGAPGDTAAKEADGAEAPAAAPPAAGGAEEKVAAVDKTPPKPKTAEEKRKEKERRAEALEKRRKEKELAALTPKKEPAKTPERKEPKKSKGGGDSIDDIIGGLGKKKTPEKKADPKPAEKKVAEKAAPAVKATLSKSDVSSVIRRSGGRIAGCARNQSGERLTGTCFVKFTHAERKCGGRESQHREIQRNRRGRMHHPGGSFDEVP